MIRYIIELIFIYYKIILWAILNSLVVGISSFLIGLIFSFLFSSLLYFYYNGIIGKFIRIVSFFIIGTPMFTQLLFIWSLFVYLFPSLSYIVISIIALSINSTAYMTRVLYSVMLSIDINEIKIAKFLGFSNLLIIRYIIYPKVLYKAIIPINNELVSLIKDTSLISSIGVLELTQVGKRIILKTFKVYEAIFMILCIYLILTSFFSFLLNVISKRLIGYK